MARKGNPYGPFFFSVVLVAILFLYATMRASLKLLPRVSYVNVARFFKLEKKIM